MSRKPAPQTQTQQPPESSVQMQKMMMKFISGERGRHFRRYCALNNSLIDLLENASGDPAAFHGVAMEAVNRLNQMVTAAAQVVTIDTVLEVSSDEPVSDEGKKS